MYLIQTLTALLEKKQTPSQSIQLLRSIPSLKTLIYYSQECLHLIHSGNSFHFSHFITTSLLQDLFNTCYPVQGKFIVLLDNEISNHSINLKKQDNYYNLAIISSNTPQLFLDNITKLITCGKGIYAIVLDSLTSFNFDSNIDPFLKALEVLNKFIVEHEILLIFGSCSLFTNHVSIATKKLCLNLKTRVVRLDKKRLEN